MKCKWLSAYINMGIAFQLCVSILRQLRSEKYKQILQKTTAMWNAMHFMKNVRLVLGSNNNYITKFILDKLPQSQVTKCGDLDLIVLTFDYLSQVYMLGQWEETGIRRHTVKLYTKNYNFVNLEWILLGRKE